MWLSGFGHMATFFLPFLHHFGILAQDMNRKQFARGDGLAGWGQLHTHRLLAAEGAPEEAWWCPLAHQPCPGCLALIGTHLTALIFLLKAEERIVSTIIPQRYIFQLYLELDTAVTLPAIASTAAPAVMDLKSLAPR